MKRVFAAAALFCLSLFPSAAYACSCGTGDPPAEFNRAKVIFIGRMLGGTEKLPVRGQDEQAYAPEAGQVRFAVEEVFKGEAAGRVTVDVTSMAGTSCGPYGLKRGETYVVYAYAYENEPGLHTGVCTRTKPAGSPYAKEDLDFLRNLPPPGVGGNLRGSIWADLKADRTTPLADVKVNVTGPGRQTVVVFTDEDGKFELRQLKPGGYRVEPELPLHYTTEDRTAEVVIQDRGTADVGFEAYIDGSVSGRVVDREGRGFNSIFLIMEGDGKRTYGHPTGEGGGFEAAGVPPGEYLLFFELQSADSEKRKNYYYPGTFRRAEATTLRVKLGEKVEGLEFRLPEGFNVGTVEGQVVWKDGEPAAGVEVLLLCPRSASPEGFVVEYSPTRTLTDVQGRFRLEGFKGETYWLEARSPREGDDTNGAPADMHSPPRKLTLGAGQKEVRLTLSESGRAGGCGK